MKVFNTISETHTYHHSLVSQQLELGLVPTMGALHEGHLSLVKKAKKENNVVAVSIFVNPIQFNDPEDLNKYPRDLDKDLKMLDSVLEEKDFVFCPDRSEIYPAPVTKVFDFGSLEEVMEGSSRPGHFNGVGVVVERLFRIIQPNRTYFGEKDFQQVAIIRKMVEIEKLDLEVISCPIIREDDGLAMSSRNQLLEPAHRKNAGIINSTINQSAKLAKNHSLVETVNILSGMINSKPGFKLEYMKFAEEKTLLAIDNWEGSDSVRCFIAVKAGKVRLIDNIKVDLNYH
jgi:pantoate--beta-alanine ligase